MSPTTIHISSSSVFKAALVLAGLYALYLLRDVVLIVLTAIVIASAVEPAARWFVKRGAPRTLAVVVIYVSVAAALFGVVYLIVPSLLSQAADVLTRIPEYVSSEQVAAFTERFSLTSPEFLQGLSESFSARDAVSGFRSLLEIPGGVFQAVSGIFGGVLSFVLIVVLSFYFSMQERGIENFLRIVTPAARHEYAVNLWRRSQQKIGRWMQGQLLLMLLVGLLVFVGLSLLRVPHAFLFAVVAGLFEVIPLFGPILSSIPAILGAFAAGGITLAFIVAGLYVVIQQFENHIIYPLVAGKVIGVPAVIIILALLIGAKLAGFLGMLLSVPMAAALMEFVSDLKQKGIEAERAMKEGV